ncbi:MAG: DEAD/DEAH box helicase [Myxococcales bacterium]|nr:DEAD/DEAH box helicase [Myxococcales bacterium]
MGTVVELDSRAFARRQAAPWEGAYGLSAVLNRWAGEQKIWSNVVLDETVPPRPAQVVPIPEGVSPAVQGALRRRGMAELYTHQAAAFELAASGRDVVVATPTASGKSLCYNLPVLDALARRSDARALYLFPTKALSRDQEEALRGFLKDAGLDHGAVTYDGDTPPDARRAARDRSGVLITNPDMLHTGVLPHHASWARFFANLEYVVVDELHMYRGVLGSHLANVMRRLLRVARFHGASPRFLFSSATIGNPAEHASRLAGREVALVGESGPTGARRVLVYNPPLVNAELGLRQSSVKASVRLAAELVRAKVSTIVFGQSRNQVEVMLKYLRDALREDKLPDSALMAYRGGYLPEQRRAIERGLREGEIQCVVATNALELGIDIGSLQAVVCAGYPGSMASTWQRFGRSGRRQGEALAVLVTSSGPLDQYLARDPRMLMEAPVEEARVDPDNVEILIQHLKCAAFELPFEAGESFGDVEPEPVQDALRFLADHRVVHPVQGRTGQTVYHWSTDAYPANDVSLRSPSWDNFVIIDVARSKTIAEMDFRSTHTMLHEQAIYQHDGAQYQVERLDYENHKAFVRRVEPDYYTTAMTHVRVSVLEEAASGRLELGGAQSLLVGHGDVDVVEKVVGFKKIKFHSHENVGYGEVNLPAVEKPTTAFWYTFPEDALAAVDAPRAVLMDALAGLLNALHAVASVGLMMDPRDLGRTLVDEPAVGPDGHAARAAAGGRSFEPTLYLYDSVAGGIGLAPRLYEEQESLLRRAHHLMARCGCQEGCPSCVGPVAPHIQAAGWSRRAVALALLSAVGLGG